MIITQNSKYLGKRYFINLKQNLTGEFVNFTVGYGTGRDVEWEDADPG